MPLLKVTEIVEIFLAPSSKNTKAVAEIKDSMLEKTNYDYDYGEMVAVDWDEEMDDFNVITVSEYHKTVTQEPPDLGSVWCTNFIQIQVLMLLIFKDDLHNIHTRDEKRKIHFLNHIVWG